MSQANETQNTAPNVQDKRKPAPGVLPKNAQTWVVMGLTAVIMLMLWVSGPAKGAKSSQKPDAAKTDTVAGLSPAEIGARLEQERRDSKCPLRPHNAFLIGSRGVGTLLLLLVTKKPRRRVIRIQSGRTSASASTRQQHFTDVMSFTSSVPTRLQTPTGK